MVKVKVIIIYSKSQRGVCGRVLRYKNFIEIIHKLR